MKLSFFASTLVCACLTFSMQVVAQTAISTEGVIESTFGGFKFPDLSVQSTGRVFPVLFDADELAIGRVVSIAPMKSAEYIVLISPEGYRAKYYYVTYPSEPTGADYPGQKAYAFFASNDCTGDPILLPNVVQIESQDVTNTNFWEIKRIYELEYMGVSAYANGDLIEYQSSAYYVPYDATATQFEIGSSKSVGDFCDVIDKCSYDTWSNYLPFLTLGIPGDPIETCVGGPFDGYQPQFIASGFALSSLLPNDPMVTGFENIPYKRPFRVKWVDANHQ